MKYIKNPILPGFNPDPSILRVDDDYFIATSTFEWFPGVQIHHSKDLIHWKLITRPLRRMSQLDMTGCPNSCGVWAPCLTYNNGIFYLVYTNVKTYKGTYKDTHNYLVTSHDICGDWSEPVYLNSSGFDPSLFHDDDGKKWLVNMRWDHRTGKNPFSGIILREYSEKEKKLIGEKRNIFKGTPLGSTEGPHIYKRNGYYYLMLAEGGTSYQHAVTIARSRTLQGPYEVDPLNPMLTSADNPDLELQKAGHASLVETQNGEWYIVHLCGRPLNPLGKCILGRETAIQKVKWTEEGWLRLENGENKPDVLVPAPDLPEHEWKNEPERDDFDNKELAIHFQSLRIPLDKELYSLEERPGFLRLRGMESLNSHHKQTLLARRQQAFRYIATTCVEFEPESFQQMAGLVCLYDNYHYYYLHITRDDDLGKYIDIIACRSRHFELPVKEKIPIKNWKRCYFQARMDYDKLTFFYSPDETEWTQIGGVFDSSILSDEFVAGGTDMHFTGAFVGICCQDLSGMRKAADFDFFEYKEIHT